MKNHFWGLGIFLLTSSQLALAQTAEEPQGNPPDSAAAPAPAPAAAPAPAPASAPASAPAPAPVGAPASETATPESPAEKEVEHATVGVFVEPLLALFGFYEGDIGVAVHENIVLGVWGQYFNYEFANLKLNGFGVGLGTQIFPLEHAFKGFYVYPMAKYQQVDFGVTGEGAAGLKYYGPQVTLGYQWNWQPFCLRLGGGVEYTFGEVSANTQAQSASTDYKGIGYEADVAIGLAF